MAGRSAEVSQNLNNLLFAIWWVHSLHRWDREVVLRAAAAAVLVLEDETDIRSVAGILEDVSWFFFIFTAHSTAAVKFLSSTARADMANA